MEDVWEAHRAVLSGLLLKQYQLFRRHGVSLEEIFGKIAEDYLKSAQMRSPVSQERQMCGFLPVRVILLSNEFCFQPPFLSWRLKS